MIVEIRGMRVDLGQAEIEDLRRQLAMPDAEIDAEVAARDARADQEAEVLDETLTIDQILAGRIVPHSRSTLYRIAKDGADDSPFYKRRGRWMATRSDLRKWIRSGAHGDRVDSPIDPMPPTRHSAAAILDAIDARGDR